MDPIPTSDGARIALYLAGEAPVRWVFTGDSITHGALHTFGFRDYTEIFSERVRYELERYRDVVIKTGISGWTIRQIRDDLDWNVLQFRPEVVSINVGMNDSVREPEGLPGFRRMYRDVIDRIRGETGAALILHTPNRILPLDAERMPVLPGFADAVRELAATSGAVLVDHFAAWEAAEADGRINYWTSDPIHPGAHGHVVMAHRLFRDVGLWDPESWVCRLFSP